MIQLWVDWLALGVQNLGDLESSFGGGKDSLMTMGRYLGNRFLITGVEQTRKGFLTPN